MRKETLLSNLSLSPSSLRILSALPDIGFSSLPLASLMASTLNPNAPLFIPASLCTPLDYFLPPPTALVTPYQYHLDHLPIYSTTFFYSPPPPPQPCCYLFPHSLCTDSSTKDFSFGFNPQFSPTRLLPPAAAALPLLGEGPTEVEEPPQFHIVQYQISNPPVKDDKEGEVEERDKGCRRSWKHKGLRGFDDSVEKKNAWVPRWRSRKRLLPIQKEKPNEGFDFKEGEERDGGEVGDSKTTVMIKNLPNKFTKKVLLELLDQHCAEENLKLSDSMERPGEMEGATTLSKFDFFYLPIDFRSGSNLGYAFVNFTTPFAAGRLHRFLHKKKWSSPASRKVCEITCARIQGLNALIKHFKNSTFVCDSDDFLPVYFRPNREGYTPCPSVQHFVGKRIPVSDKPAA